MSMRRMRIADRSSEQVGPHERDTEIDEDKAGSAGAEDQVRHSECSGSSPGEPASQRSKISMRIPGESRKGRVKSEAGRICLALAISGRWARAFRIGALIGLGAISWTSAMPGESRGARASRWTDTCARAVLLSRPARKEIRPTRSGARRVRCRRHTPPES